MVFARSYDIKEFKRMIHKHPNLTFQILKQSASGSRVLQREQRIYDLITKIQEKLICVEALEYETTKAFDIMDSKTDTQKDI